MGNINGQSAGFVLDDHVCEVSLPDLKRTAWSASWQETAHS